MYKLTEDQTDFLFKLSTVPTNAELTQYEESVLFNLVEKGLALRFQEYSYISVDGFIHLHTLGYFNDRYVKHGK
jgi:hypothetical protein